VSILSPRDVKKMAIWKKIPAVRVSGVPYFRLMIEDHIADIRSN
jgi:hypothetical protein